MSKEKDKSKKKRLGSGLGSLFPEGLDNSIAFEKNTKIPKKAVQTKKKETQNKTTHKKKKKKKKN